MTKVLGKSYESDRDLVPKFSFFACQNRPCFILALTALKVEFKFEFAK